MLVLTRRLGQKVVFPSLGITVEILRSRGSVIRLGIGAPDDVPILRDEVLVKQTPPPDAGSRSPPSADERQRHHELRNQLNHLILKLQLLEYQLQYGTPPDSEPRLAEVISGLVELERTTADRTIHSPAPKILVVEDQANERELLATCLRLGGAEAVTAGNGREAFDYLQEHDLPDLVLLDMHMPEMDGPTFLKTVRDDVRLRKLRVFAVSGHPPGTFDANPLPLDGWFSKPVRIDALLQAVRGELGV